MRKSLMKALVAVLATLAVNQSALAFEGRVFINATCPVTNTNQQQEAAGIGAAILGKFVSGVVGASIDYLTAELAKDQVTTVISTERINGWYDKVSDTSVASSSDIGCISVIIADSFGRRSANAVATPEFAEAIKGAGSLKAGDPNSVAAYRLAGAGDKLAKMGAISVPLMYFEAVFVRHGQSPVFSLQPTFIYYPRFFGKRAFGTADTRDILLQFDFSLPGASGPFASHSISFEQLAEGQLTTQRISDLRLPWAKDPSTQEADLKGESPLLPFNVKILFSETSKPGLIAKVVSAGLTSSKATIQSSAEEATKLAVSESERVDARKTASDTASTSLNSYYDAYDAYQKALVAQKQATTTVDKIRTAGLVTVAKSKFENAEQVTAFAMASAGLPFTKLPPVN